MAVVASEATRREYVARMNRVVDQWGLLVADWLPAGYQPDHRPAMEFYLNNPETDPEGKYRVEICLLVRPL